MTVPVAPVQIHPQFTPYQGTPGVEMLLTALQHRQALNLEKQKFAQDQQAFELHKKLVGSQLAGSDLDNAKKQADLRDREHDLQAKDQALQLITGNLPRLDDSKGIGEVLANIKDPAVAAHFFDYMKEHLGITGQLASNRGAEASATKLETANAGESTVRTILGKADLTSEAGQRSAIREALQTAGPDAADQLARTLNVGVGRYGHIVGPDGYLYITDSKTGGVRRDTAVGQKADNARVEAIRRNAGTLVDLLDEQSKLIQNLGIGASKNPTGAALLEGARVLGVSTEALSNALRSDPEQITRMLRTRFSHNYVGLLPNSRSAAQLLQNLAESYWAPPSSSPTLLRRAEQDRQKLRTVLVGVRDGKITDMSRIPGFSAAAAAAAADGVPSPVPQAGGAVAPPNPDDWYKP